MVCRVVRPAVWSKVIADDDRRRCREDADNLPAPEVIAREIVEDLTAALAEFEAVASALEGAAPPVIKRSGQHIASRTMFSNLENVSIVGL